MSRRALFFSLALHAAFLALIGNWLVSSAGPGDPGAGATFSAASAGGLLVEIAPAFEAAPTPLPPEPELAPPAPTLETPPLPVEPLTAKTSPIPPAPAISPIATEVKSNASKSARTKPAGSRASRASPGAGGSTTGLAGTGSGGGPGYVAPQYRLRYKPAYPEEARARRLEGTVLLLVSLDASGRVTAATLQVTCGHAILDSAALKAVRSWLFDPARQNGTAIAAQVEIPIRFRFQERTARRA